MLTLENPNQKLLLQFQLTSMILKDRPLRMQEESLA